MKLCEELGFDSHFFLILGFPTATQEDLDRTIEAIDCSCADEPVREVLPFTLRSGSPADQALERFGIRRKRSVGLFSDVQYLAAEWRSEITPRELCVPGVDYWFLDFEQRETPRCYDRLAKRLNRWNASYHMARLRGQPLLFCYDGIQFLNIEDFRELGEGETTDGILTRRLCVTLEGWQRDLFLFCDSIRHVTRIAEAFPQKSQDAITGCLDQLAEKKVVFREGDEYLSLAVNARAEHRRNAPFPWI